MEQSDHTAAIRLESVSVAYRVPHERIGTLKEYVIRWAQRRVKYEKFLALNDVSLTINRGEIVGLIGHNGAGKSTLLKLVSRVLTPTSGRVWVRGKVAPLLELGAGFHPELTGRENIYLNGAILGYSRKEMDQKAGRIIDFAELGEFIDAPIRTYSSGMWARLGFAVATDSKPDILILDEVMAVGDEAFQRKSETRMRSYFEMGATILLVSHNMEMIEKLCTRAVWLDHGVIKCAGSPDKTIQEYRWGQPA
ncbi:MAG: ABC transporter ATP-binding protein [Bellilinea sp.]